MANPQPDQFTKFSNDLLDKFLLVAPKLSPSAVTVWLAIFRLTYGFQKKKARIALSTLSKATGMQIPLVCRAIKKLKSENMITNEDGIRGIQKDYDKWSLLHKQTVAKQPVAKSTDSAHIDSTATAQTDNKLLHKQPISHCTNVQTIKKEYKENIKKEENTSAHRAVVKYFCELHESQLGVKYSFTAKDGKLVKDLVAKHSLEDIRIRIDTLFYSTKAFYKNNRTIGILSSCWNQLSQEGLGRQMKILPKVIERNLRAGLEYLNNNSSGGHDDNSKVRISQNVK